MVSASQQVGGSLGTALLSTFSVAAVTDYLTNHLAGPSSQVEAMVHSYRVGFIWAAPRSWWWPELSSSRLCAVESRRRPTEGASVHFG